jgi:hypothetical protein
MRYTSAGGIMLIGGKGCHQRNALREMSRPMRRLAWAGSETMRGCRIGRRIDRRATMNARR